MYGIRRGEKTLQELAIRVRLGSLSPFLSDHIAFGIELAKNRRDHSIRFYPGPQFDPICRDADSISYQVLSGRRIQTD